MSLSYLTLSLSGLTLNVPTTSFLQLTNNYTVDRSTPDWTVNGSGKFTYTGTSTILVVFHTTRQQTSSTTNVQLALTLRRNGNNDSNINLTGQSNDTNGIINEETSSLGNTSVNGSVVNNFSNGYGILIYPNDYFYCWLYNAKPSATVTGFGCKINIMSNYLYINKSPFNQYYVKVSMSNTTVTNAGGTLTTALTTLSTSGDFIVNNGGDGRITFTGSVPRKFMFHIQINITTVNTGSVGYNFGLRRETSKLYYLLDSYPVSSSPSTFDASIIGYYDLGSLVFNYGIVFNPNDTYLIYARKINGAASVNANIDLLMVSY